MEKPKEIDIRFDYFEVEDKDKMQRMIDVRASVKNAATVINEKAIDSREKSLALTHLEIALFYAIASIARREGM